MTDRKIQMMDAGTALFDMEGGFGTALGQLRAELKEYGKVHDEDEDLVLDFSTLWRRRIIVCRLEGAGDIGDRHRYAAVFKEGSASTPLRGLVHGALCAVFAAGLALHALVFPAVPGLPAVAVCIAGLAASIWSWISPSRSSIETVRKLIGKTGSLK